MSNIVDDIVVDVEDRRDEQNTTGKLTRDFIVIISDLGQFGRPGPTDVRHISVYQRLHLLNGNVRLLSERS